MTAQRQRKSNDGMALLLVLGIMAAVALFAAAFLVSVRSTIAQARSDSNSHAARNAAEGGIELALARLNADASFQGEQQIPLGEMALDVEVASLPQGVRIACDAYPAYAYRLGKPAAKITAIASNATGRWRVAAWENR